MTALDVFTRNWLPEDASEIVEIDLTNVEPKARHIWVRVNSGSGRVLLLDIRNISVGDPQQEHLCVDAFPFIDGAHANVGYFGMTNGGNQHTTDATGFTSHGWPATGMGVLLLGKQGKDEVDGREGSRR